jgi:hypothetical protein
VSSSWHIPSQMLVEERDLSIIPKKNGDMSDRLSSSPGRSSKTAPVTSIRSLPLNQPLWRRRPIAGDSGTTSTGQLISTRMP